MRCLPAFPAELAWLCKRADCVLSPQAVAMKAVDEKGEIHGMIAYDFFTENSCQVHLAVPSPIAWRHLIPNCFRYPFEVMKLGLVLGVVSSTNLPGLRLAKTLGFSQAHRIKDAWAVGVDMVIHEIRPADCRRWLTRSAETKEASSGQTD